MGLLLLREGLGGIIECIEELLIVVKPTGGYGRGQLRKHLLDLNEYIEG